jgi:chemotaxis protein methyltransferase CheR
VNRRTTFEQASPFGAMPCGADIDELCAIVERRTGLTVSEAKRDVVAVRLSARLRELRVPSLDAYCRLVEQGDGELLYVIDLVTTHETSFFRHPHHFAFLEHDVLPQWRTDAACGRRPHEARVWSAGCSTGEEPYSIAMVLHAGLSPSLGWNLEVLGTDISEAALDTARRATFTEGRAAPIPGDHRRLFMREVRGAAQPAFRVDRSVASTVRFERLNLLDDFYPVGRNYDVVFCRNVLIYLRPEERRMVVDRLVDHLAPDGYVVLGQAEGLLGVPRLRRVAPTVYRVGNPTASTLPPPPRLRSSTWVRR